MAWAKLDDRLDSHPKILRAWAAQPAAIGLWTLGLTYSSRHALDGFIPAEVVGLWRPPAGAIDTLVDQGLWERETGGWQIHDFGDYNPTGDVRAKRAKAGRKGGRASGASRRRAKQELEAT